MLGRRGDEPVDDLGVDVLEPIGRLVDVVEADRVADQMGARVARRPHEPVLVAVDLGERLGRDVSRYRPARVRRS